LAIAVAAGVAAFWYISRKATGTGIVSSAQKAHTRMKFSCRTTPRTAGDILTMARQLALTVSTIRAAN
jgi:hypothetical protein